MSGFEVCTGSCIYTGARWSIPRHSNHLDEQAQSTRHASGRQTTPQCSLFQRRGSPSRSRDDRGGTQVDLSASLSHVLEGCALECWTQCGTDHGRIRCRNCESSSTNPACLELWPQHVLTSTQINSFFGHPAFRERFGSRTATGELYIPANWQSAINNAATIGQLAGLTFNGWAQAKYGSRPVYIGGMAWMIAAIFIPVFSTSLGMLFAGEVVCGVVSRSYNHLPRHQLTFYQSWGIFQTLTTAYASEICPVSMRGYLTSYVNMCWGMGGT